MYEDYKDIPGYEGLYKINRTGDIISFNSGKGKPRLRAHSIHVDRHFIALSKDGVNKRFPVANLVAETFGLPNPHGYKTIAFKDGNFGNLSLDNLEWAPLSKARKEISPEARARAAATLRAMGHKPTEKVLNALRRKIAAYDDDGNWVATFRSVADAQRIVGGSIGQALIHGCRAGGFHWKYVENAGGEHVATLEEIKNILDGEASNLSYSILDIYDVSIQNSKYIASCRFYTDAGEDFCFDIWFNGTWADFVKNFLEYCENYDPDAHAEQYVNMRGKNGIPSTIRELINDADSIGEYLSNWASELWEKRGKYDDNWNEAK